MISNPQKISCPKCSELISIDDVLTRQIEEKIKKDFEGVQKIKDQELAAKAEELKKLAAEITEAKKNMESEIASKMEEKLSIERLRIFKEAETKAEKEQSAKALFLEEQLKSKDEKLAQATQNEISLRKEKIKLEEDKQAFELEKMRQMEEA